MNKFVFVAPVYNAEDTVQQMLWSIAGQTYDNWKVILIDDMSTDSTKQAIHNFAYMCASSNCWKNISHDQIELIENTEKKWEVANVLAGIAKCDDNDIVCRIDGDDYLCDLDALQILNQVYDDSKLEALWTNHRWFDKNGVTSRNISGPLTHPDVYKSEWRTSHLKTFRKYLINDVKDENFRGQDGEYIRRAGDRAIFLPIAHRAKRKAHLPLVVYSYHCDMSPQTFQTQDAIFQKQEADFLHQRGFVQ